jgi:hypothetical protein
MWYQTDADLRDEAEFYGKKFLDAGGRSDQLLAHVEKKMKTKHPELGPKRAAPSPTANGDRTARPSSKEIVLDELEQDIMNKLVKSGEMTEAQYKAELKRAKGIR